MAQQPKKVMTYFGNFIFIYPLKNYVTDFSLYIRAVGAHPQKERKCKLQPTMTADWSFQY